MLNVGENTETATADAASGFDCHLPSIDLMT
jgi:hypothetical protein